MLIQRRGEQRNRSADGFCARKGLNILTIAIEIRVHYSQAKGTPGCQPIKRGSGKRLRTANALERVNQELKRRTRVARVFPNESALLRLITALLCETSDEWETGKIYLTMENHNPSSV